MPSLPEVCTDQWARVGEWLVAPTYIAPVGIGEAEALAKLYDCELPTAEFVDAIWQAADLKIAPITRSVDNHLLTDWGASMYSEATFADQQERIAAAIAGREFQLLAGSHKDVCRKDGVLGIYGWHTLEGKPTQGFYAKHAPGWKDYSQGLRLVRRAS